MMNFTDKTFIITGASEGIGKALALKLASQGTKLVLAARNQDALEKIADACIQSGTQALSVPTDVTNDVLVVSPGFVATDIRNRILGADGKPIVAGLPKGQKNLMSVEECVHQIVRAMQGRKRELVMTSQGHLSRWLQLIAPDLLDRIVAQKFFSK